MKVEIIKFSLSLYIYIYIYIERERERGRERCIKQEDDNETHLQDVEEASRSRIVDIFLQPYPQTNKIREKKYQDTLLIELLQECVILISCSTSMSFLRIT